MDRPSLTRHLPNLPHRRDGSRKEGHHLKVHSRRKSIKTVEKVEELLKNMFVAAIDEDYIVELKQGLSEYDGRTLRELLAHYKKYGKMDDTVHSKIMETFREAPDLDVPIDKYFAKQEECQKLVVDTDNPINDAAMVLQLTQHLGKMPP